MDKQSRKELKEQYKNRTRIGGVYCIKCNVNGEQWIRTTMDIQGSKNRFSFSLSMDSYPEQCMETAWKKYGKSAFSFEVLEELQMSETQTEQEFLADINTLLEIWNEKCFVGKVE